MRYYKNCFITCRVDPRGVPGAQLPVPCLLCHQRFVWSPKSTQRGPTVYLSPRSLSGPGPNPHLHRLVRHQHRIFCVRRVRLQVGRLLRTLPHGTVPRTIAGIWIGSAHPQVRPWNLQSFLSCDCTLCSVQPYHFRSYI